MKNYFPNCTSLRHACIIILCKRYLWARASRCEHIILPISSTAIFSVLIKIIWYMLDTTAPPRGSALRCNIAAIYIALYSKSLNPTLHISRRSSVGGAIGLQSKGCWFEPTLLNYLSSNNVRLLVYTSLQVKTHNQNEWSVTNQIGYTGFRRDSYLKFIWRLFYRKGPALSIMVYQTIRKSDCAKHTPDYQIILFELFNAAMQYQKYFDLGSMTLVVQDKIQLICDVLLCFQKACDRNNNPICRIIGFISIHIMTKFSFYIKTIATYDMFITMATYDIFIAVDKDDSQYLHHEQKYKDWGILQKD